jgi:hypothetical protein
MAKIFLGHKPVNKADAWWALPREAKQALAEYRAGGKFGGTPGQAPYWWSVNYGLESANIVGRHFLESASQMWKPQATRIVRRWIKLYCCFPDTLKKACTKQSRDCLPFLTQA